MYIRRRLGDGWDLVADWLRKNVFSPSFQSNMKSVCVILRKYSKFIGPGLMVSVAYMDPGNYSTAVAAGSAYEYKLLFAVLLTNCLAVFLQVLSARLGAVTGLDLATNCQIHLPHKLNIFVYILAELSIIATDVAEVVGTAISLNILFNLPLLAGVVATIIDTLVVLMAYRPDGPMIFIRIFESIVSMLVGVTIVCFAVELYQISHDDRIGFSVVEVFKGFLPNKECIDLSEDDGESGLYMSLAIMGATVMPHSLYLGSGIVQSRLKEYDKKHGYFMEGQKEEVLFSQPDMGANERSLDSDSPSQRDKLEGKDVDVAYRPSIHAIKNTISYTLSELVISTLTVALFVNSTILIVAGATVYEKDKDDFRAFQRRDDDDDDDDDNEVAGLYTIYQLLCSHLSPTAGVIYALALLCSGQSASIVCTLAGQMVLEGFVLWSVSPLKRRIITRSLAIIPCLVIVSLAGRDGLSNILNASQILLSILLPVVTAPLIYFTCSKKIMNVPIRVRDVGEDIDIVLDHENSSSYQAPDSNPSSYVSRKVREFNEARTPLILEDLRLSHFDREENNSNDIQHNSHDNQHNIPSIQAKSHSNVERSTNEYMDRSEGETTSATATHIDLYSVKGYKDMSNSNIVSFIAILTWLFITLLNLFLLGSLALGYEIPM